MNSGTGKSDQNTNGFMVAMSPSAAARQLRISLAVAMAFAAATIVTMVIGHIQPRITGPASLPSANVKLTIQMPGIVKMHQISTTDTKAIAPPQRGI